MSLRNFWQSSANWSRTSAIRTLIFLKQSSNTLNVPGLSHIALLARFPERPLGGVVAASSVQYCTVTRRKRTCRTGSSFLCEGRGERRVAQRHGVDDRADRRIGARSYPPRPCTSSSAAPFGVGRRGRLPAARSRRRRLEDGGSAPHQGAAGGDDVSARPWCVLRIRGTKRSGWVDSTTAPAALGVTYTSRDANGRATVTTLPGSRTLATITIWPGTRSP